MKTHFEYILSVENSLLIEYLKKDEVINLNHNLHKTTLNDFSNFFCNDIIIKNRDRLEEDPTFRQLIPYVVFKNKNNEFYTYVRGNDVGETRLVHNASIGVGGHSALGFIHIREDSSINLANSMLSTAWAEITEELNFDQGTLSKIFDDLLCDQTQIYLIKDDSNDVGRVHLGIVLILDVPYDIDLNTKELELESLGFTPVHVLKGLNLEPWSKILLNNIFE